MFLESANKVVVLKRSEGMRLSGKGNASVAVQLKPPTERLNSPTKSISALGVLDSDPLGLSRPSFLTERISADPAPDIAPAEGETVSAPFRTTDPEIVIKQGTCT